MVPSSLPHLIITTTLQLINKETEALPAAKFPEQSIYRNLMHRIAGPQENNPLQVNKERQGMQMLETTEERRKGRGREKMAEIKGETADKSFTPSSVHKSSTWF